MLSQTAGSPFLRLKVNDVFFLGIALHILTLWKKKDLSRIGVKGNYPPFRVCGENEALSNEARHSSRVQKRKSGRDIYVIVIIINNLSNSYPVLSTEARFYTDYFKVANEAKLSGY